MMVGHPNISAGERTVRLAPAMLALVLAVALPAICSRADQETAAKMKQRARGEQDFVSRCAMCHGIDGRGGEHAPNIATAAAVQQLSDAELERILHDGIPARGMPSFQALGQAGVKAVVGYLRVLQGKPEAAKISGNPWRGKDLFFGSAHCSDCHMVRGHGGFLGPELSHYSLSHSPESIRQAIIAPDWNVGPRTDTVTAVTHDGRKFVGIARNEDNFSLQLQTLDGSFHLLMKSELASLSHDHTSPMPSDYASRLSVRDLDDIVGFLVSVSAESGREEASRSRHWGSD